MHEYHPSAAVDGSLCRCTMIHVGVLPSCSSAASKIAPPRSFFCYLDAARAKLSHVEPDSAAARGIGICCSAAACFIDSSSEVPSVSAISGSLGHYEMSGAVVAALRRPCSATVHDIGNSCSAAARGVDNSSFSASAYGIDAAHRIDNSSSARECSSCVFLTVRSGI